MRSIFIASSFALAAVACSPEAPQASSPNAAPSSSVAVSSAPVALAITDASGTQLVGDAERGRRVFAQCTSCHSIEAGVNRVGPTLHGVIGREAGSVPGFRYSEANSTSHIVWSEQELFDYLENPRALVPGTTMAFAGIRNPQQRADVIAYIKTASETE
jgi:cytochrome c